jgi:hypothetical protein
MIKLRNSSHIPLNSARVLTSSLTHGINSISIQCDVHSLNSCFCVCLYIDIREEVFTQIENVLIIIVYTSSIMSSCSYAC